MNFGRQRSVELGNKAGAMMADGKGGEVYGAFFGQSSMARMALVSEASVSFGQGDDVRNADQCLYSASKYLRARI
jgi:hypothetical protein